MNPEDIIKAHYEKIGTKGGKATAAKYGPDHMRDLQVLGAKARRKNKAARKALDKITRRS